MVYSFEPFPQNISLLKINMQNYKDKSKIFENALSDKEGTMPLYNSQDRKSVV